MNIRKAVLSDVPRLIELGERFALESQKAHGLNISRRMIGEFADYAVTSEKCIFMVLEDTQVVGMIIGVLMYPFFSEDLVVQELVWYVEKGCSGGIRLLKAMEKIATAMGATKLIVGSKPDYVDMSDVYMRLGYKALEFQYVKGL